ncbi:MAG: FkbM family methyltransferase [Vicingus serpentipes]|nr:FkbM family methyltransferase [Vicingus serpentipes]
MSSALAPIILFTYNRPLHTQKTLNALAKNPQSKDSILYIYCDGVKKNTTSEELKKINEVREFVKKENRFKEIIIKVQETNIGLADSILNGVTEVINKHKKIIVLEDDIKVADSFLTYMNEALNYFEQEQRVFHINGFNNESNLQFLLKDYYFLNFMSCWGWATWKDRWDKLNLDYQYFYQQLILQPKLLFNYNYSNVLNHHAQLKANIDKEIKTWAILWYSTVFFNEGLCLTPKYSLVENIGMDGSGEHCDITSFYKKKYFVKNLPLKKYLKSSKLRYEELFTSRLHLKLFYKYGAERPLLLIFLSLFKGILKKKISRLKQRLNSPKEYLIERINCNKKWYGNEYGGFYVHPDLLNDKSFVYSFGIGEDVSFDLAIIQNHNSQVFAFDPTPKSITWVTHQDLPANFHFYDFGIDVKDGERAFNLPSNENHVSGSVFSPSHVSENRKIEVKMKSLRSIMKDLKHQHIDVLKMDIEGSEYDVLLDIINSNIKVGQILAEFHDRFFSEGNNKSKKVIKALEKKGYYIFGVSASKQEISFLNKRWINK